MLYFFTGDLVNNQAVEMKEWISTFFKGKKRHWRVFSVFGNHDYGDYVSWDSSRKRQKLKLIGEYSESNGLECVGESKPYSRS